MWPDRVSKPGPLTYESGALPTALRGPARGVAETRLIIEKLPNGHNSGKNQSSMTSVKYDHLQVMEKITEKFHQNPLKNVG